MSTGKTDKKERNDIYTAFVVLGLFLLFGFYMTGSSLFTSDSEFVADWVEQPVAPVGYEGYPYPHDDNSVEEVLPMVEEIDPLPQRKMRPVSSTAVATTVAPVATGKRTPEVDKAAVVPAVEPVKKLEPKIVLEEKVSVPTPALAQPKVEKKLAPAAAPRAKLEKKVVPVAPVVKSMPVVAVPKPAPIDNREAGMNYISSQLPCVWIVGIFKNPNNVNRVVARLRLNKFDVGTGAHEKGTYVGVPCKCSGEESTAVQLREIFAAQPWLLRK